MRRQLICPYVYSNSKQHVYTHKKSIVKGQRPPSPARPASAFNKQRPLTNPYSSAKSTSIREILYHMTNTNGNYRYAHAGNTPTPSSMPTYTRVLSTQAPGWLEATSNRQSTQINQYSSIKSISIPTIVSTTNTNNDNCPLLYYNSKQCTYPVVLRLQVATCWLRRHTKVWIQTRVDY